MLLLFLIISSFISNIANKFDPYVDNGGTVVGLACKEFCLVAADSRLSEQYFIRSRSLSRIFQALSYLFNFSLILYFSNQD
jgi:20S proteasome alpha/beta subunit